MKLVEDKFLADVLKVAQDAHAGQTRKFSGSAYIKHPFRVYKRLKKFGADKDTLAAALLHDTIEDTFITYDDLKKQFNKNIADTVKWLSNVGDKNAHIQKLMKSGPYEAVLIKTFDRIDNLNDGGSPKFFMKYKGGTDIIRDGLKARGFTKLLKEFDKTYEKVYGDY